MSRTSIDSAIAGPVADRRVGVITFAVPDLEEPYFAELTALMVRRAGARGLSVLIQQTEGAHDQEVDVIDGVGSAATDGLIHIPRSLTVADLTRRRAPGPLVLLGEHVESSPFAHVTIDNHAAAAAATEHLLDRGCRRIAMIGPRTQDVSDAANRRYLGFVDALRARRAPVLEALAPRVATWTSQEGRCAAQALLASGEQFDGVVAANDSVAFGVMSALQEAGVAIPGDVAVIGMDDVIAARYSTPTLSSVAPDKTQLVERALDVLERQMNAHPAADQPIEQRVVGFHVIPRGSTAR